MKLKDKVYVIDWSKSYSDNSKYNNETKEYENVLPFKTVIPKYSEVRHHWKYIYEDNLTLKGTINKREPKKLVEKLPIYKDFKYEIVEIIKHPKAGEYYFNEEDRLRFKDYDKYPSENILLLKSTHKEEDWQKCWVIINEKGVSTLTPEQYTDAKFNALVESNLRKWDRNAMNKKDIPETLISKIYNEDDNVLFGSCYTKGKVSFHYLDGKYSTDGKHIYLHSSILYDGEGNSTLPKDAIIMSFNNIKKHIEQ